MKEKKRRITLLEIILILVIVLLLAAIILPELGADSLYGKDYFFEFLVKDEEGHPLQDVEITPTCWIEQGHLMPREDTKVLDTENGYEVKYRFRWLTATIKLTLCRPLTWPSAFSFSVEKDGFKKQDVKFTMEELEDKYLEEAGEDKMVFRLPDFVLEKEGTNVSN